MYSFQICYEGDLTLELADAVRRLKGEPNFDKSWFVVSKKPRRSETLLRYLRQAAGGDGSLMVGRMIPHRTREFLLIRHSFTHGFDYAPLLRGISSLGSVLDVQMRGTYVVRSSDPADAMTLGERLGELCPYDSLMVVGISHDFSIWSSAVGMFTAAEEWLIRSEELRS